MLIIWSIHNFRKCILLILTWPWIKIYNLKLYMVDSCKKNPVACLRGRTKGNSRFSLLLRHRQQDSPPHILGGLLIFIIKVLIIVNYDFDNYLYSIKWSKSLSEIENTQIEDEKRLWFEKVGSTYLRGFLVKAGGCLLK